MADQKTKIRPTLEPGPHEQEVIKNITTRDYQPCTPEEATERNATAHMILVALVLQKRDPMAIHDALQLAHAIFHDTAERLGAEEEEEEGEGADASSLSARRSSAAQDDLDADTLRDLLNNQTGPIFVSPNTGKPC